MNPDQTKRLGAGRFDGLEVKSHKYFKDVNWKKVFERKLKPPKPIINRFKGLWQVSGSEIFKETNVSSDTFIDNKVEGWSFINNIPE